MTRALVTGCLFFVLCVSASFAADDAKWGTIKGKVTWQGKDPDQEPIKAIPACNAAPPVPEDYIINPKNKGLKNVFVWIRPDGAEKDAAFPKEKIHPDLVKPAKTEVDIDQPCCTFIPHVLAAREGQQFIIKNSATFAHNAKFDSKKNGSINPLLPAGASHKLEKPLVFESGEITLQCNIHGWMKAHIRIFDHPYYAVTDADGNFEIKNAPLGKFNLFVHHPHNGWLGGVAGRNGMPMNIKGDQDLGELKMGKN